MAFRPIRRRAALSGLILVAPAIIGCRGKSTVTGQKRAPAGSPPSPDLATILHRVEGVPALDGDGATVHRVFPSKHLRHLDPFVLLDDFHVSPPAGFPMHPHRGFEAFTYMVDGAFHHTDDMGNDSVVSTGGTQRFLSGRGARHSEMPGAQQVNRGLQLWINLPRRLKKMAPEYQAATELPREVDELRSVTHILGNGSPQDVRTAVDYADVALLADATFTRDVEDGWNTLLYVLEGTVEVGGARVGHRQGVLLGTGRLEVTGGAGSKFVYLSGKPHEEPIKHRGPFVD